MSRFMLLALALAAPVSAADWPQFRGPTGDGHYAGPRLPTEWGPDTNVAWKAAIPGKGWSSPIVSKGKVYLTTAVAQSNGDQSLRALCLNADTGKVEWDNQVFLAPKKRAIAHKKNSHASATPTTDGERVYVHFGHNGTAALDLDGKVLWTRTGFYDEPMHGNGGSPVMVDGLIVFSCDAFDRQVVVALDAGTGKTAWETPRKTKANNPFSFGTPTVVEVNGKKQVVSQGSNVLAGYDSKTGEELWRTAFDGYSVIPKPVAGHDMVYFSTGFDSPKVIAIKLGGSSDVTKSHTAWTLNRGAPSTPSPLLVGEELYLVADRGQFSCVDARTGKVVWQDKLKGNYSASPIVADGNIYLTSEEGKGTLVKAGRKKEVLGEFDMKEPTFASFAAAEGALYVRTESKLYKFTGR